MQLDVEGSPPAKAIHVDLQLASKEIVRNDYMDDCQMDFLDGQKNGQRQSNA